MKRSKKNISRKLSRKIRRQKQRKLTKHLRQHSKRHSKKYAKYTKQKGGYSQYLSNTPISSSYGLAGPIPANLSALANPIPIKLNGGDCVDNYNRYTNTGF
jgi:hypothetical protein